MEQPKSWEDFDRLFKQFNVPYFNWGSGKAKTLGDLLKELNQGEAELVVDGSNLFRQVKVACLDIVRGNRLLWEDFQLFYDGLRRRTRHMDSSTGEKMKRGETPEDAIKRLIREEFPILLAQVGAPTKKDVRYRESESESYPGLITRYEFHFFEIELTVELPPITVQETDKLVAYKWIPRHGG